MRSLNQCAQCGFSESVVHTARGEAGGGVRQGQAEAEGGQAQMVAGSLIRVDVLPLTLAPKK